ncbi:MAG: hypothetical protein EAZ44_03885 [Cytophagia bacterium]|nr:MAG: hypothetical protein EAZ44_03885 [Cytophagia bacterium]TAG44173.1 MAG: hypothetical protein EAZ31_02915 [Cytophagia bacterium]
MKRLVSFVISLLFINTIVAQTINIATAVEVVNVNEKITKSLFTYTVVNENGELIDLENPISKEELKKGMKIIVRADVENKVSLSSAPKRYEITNMQLRMFTKGRAVYSQNLATNVVNTEDIIKITEAGSGVQLEIITLQSINASGKKQKLDIESHFISFFVSK